MINENVESGYDSGRILYDKDIREPLFDFLEETYGKIRIFYLTCSLALRLCVWLCDDCYV